MNQFREVLLSVHNHHDAFRRFPFVLKDGESDQLSWRARIPVFMFSDIEYSFDLSKPWDDPANKKYAEQMPEAFGDDGKTTGICRIVTTETPTSFEQISSSRGVSNTIMLINSPQRVPWTQNKDLTIDEAVAIFKGLKDDEKLIVGFYDGAVRRLGKETSEDEFRAMLKWKDE